MSKLVNVGGAWKAKKGFSGRFGHTAPSILRDKQVLFFKNDHKKADNHPDINIVMTEEDIAKLAEVEERVAIQGEGSQEPPAVQKVKEIFCNDDIEF